MEMMLQLASVVRSKSVQCKNVMHTLPAGNCNKKLRWPDGQRTAPP